MSSESAAKMAYRDKYWKSADNLRLHARDYQPDKAARERGVVVCLPGLTRNSADFDALAVRLMEMGWRVLAVDLRGRAGSDHAKDSRSYNARTYADDVASLLGELGIERAIFIGTSLGVLVTMTIAMRRKGLVVAAVLNDAGPQVPRAALSRIGQYAGKVVPPMTDAEASAYVERIGKASFPKYGPDEWVAMVLRMFRRREDGLLVLDYDPAIVRTASPLMLWLLRPMLWRAWRRLCTCGPMLILRGELSDILTPDVAGRMANEGRDTRLVVVPGVGHAPMLDEPESVAAIVDFLERVA